MTSSDQSWHSGRRNKYTKFQEEKKRKLLNITFIKRKKKIKSDPYNYDCGQSYVLQHKRMKVQR